MSVQIEQFSYDDAIVRKFALATVFWGLIGMLAGLLAAAGATLAGYLLATNLFELDYGFSGALWLAGPLLGVLLVGLSGMAATWRVVTHTPVSVLRAA